MYANDMKSMCGVAEGGPKIFMNTFSCWPQATERNCSRDIEVIK